jgi:hypothetical protein
VPPHIPRMPQVPLLVLCVPVKQVNRVLVSKQTHTSHAAGPSLLRPSLWNAHSDALIEAASDVSPAESQESAADGEHAEEERVHSHSHAQVRSALVPLILRFRSALVPLI